MKGILLPSPKPETCANCNRPIGALEEVYLWQDHPVCVECYVRLVEQSRPLPRPPAASSPSHSQPQLIERTPKRYKGLILIGCAMGSLGIGLVVIGWANPDMQMGDAPSFLAVVGCGIWIFARIAAWWQTG